MIELAFETGLRVSEISALTCGDLNLQGQRPGIRVERGKGGTRRFVRIRPTFCDQATDYLHWKTRQGESVTAGAAVFPSPQGGHLGVRALQKRFARIMGEAGISGHSLHHCRHTYASELLRASGGNLRLVQKQLGHKKITTTQIYADIFDPDMTAALDQLYTDA